MSSSKIERLRASGPRSKPETPDLDRHWHLAQNDHQIALTELEYSLIRTVEAFNRWQSECLAAASGKALSGGDNVVLHVIRMNDRPKSVTEIARLTNRDDISNVQYTIRKLLKAGLVEKIASHRRRRGTSYRVTAKGRDVTDRYARLRVELLCKLTGTIKDVETYLENGSRVLDLMSGIYDQAARVAATHRPPVDDEAETKPHGDSGSADP